MQARITNILTTFALLLCVPLQILGQGLTSSSKVTLLNASHNRLELRSPASAFANYSLTFPAATPSIGAIGYFSNATGQLTWLSAGNDGQVLTLSQGVPSWATPVALTGWTLNGNSIAASYNGSTGSFIGTTNPQPLILATANTTIAQPIQLLTNNTERVRIAPTGELLVGTTTPISTVTVNGETYSNTFRTLTTNANPAYAEGRVFYDSTEKSMAYFNDHNGLTMNLGQEEWIRVFNTTGTTIPNGSAVYINGANSIAGLPTIALAKADQLTTTDAIGICTEAIPNNSSGYVTSFGEVHQINTSSYSAGQTLYLSATAAGALTVTRPSQPNFTNPVGYVTKVDAISGEILVMAGKSRQGAMTSGAIAFGGDDGYIRQAPDKFFYDSTNFRLGIGTNTPGTAIDLTGDLSIRFHGITLSADTVDDAAIGSYSYVGITGRTNNYFISGISGGTDGKQLQLINLTPKAMKLFHQSTRSNSANRIYNPSGQDITLADSGTVGLVYNGLLNCWVVQSSVSAMSGTSAFTIRRQKTDQSITNSTTFQTASDFNYNVKPNSVYEIEIVIFDSGIGGAYFTGTAILPTGCTISGVVETGISGNIKVDTDIIRNGVISNSAGINTMSGVAGYVKTHAILITGSNGGNASFAWGMLSSSATKTLWLFKDSYSIIRLIGKT